MCSFSLRPVVREELAHLINVSLCDFVMNGIWGPLEPIIHNAIQSNSIEDCSGHRIMLLKRLAYVRNAMEFDEERFAAFIEGQDDWRSRWRH